MSAPHTDESNIGIILWFVLIAEIAVTVVVMDVWLYRNGHEMLTSEVKEGLKNPVWGAVLAFVMAGAVAALVWHFYNTRDGSTLRHR